MGGIVMNFKSQTCTTKDQSKKLLALGLGEETADMTIHIKNDGGWYVTADPFCEWEDDINTIQNLEETDPILPAWSLDRPRKRRLCSFIQSPQRLGMIVLWNI